jgi:hypothetical protein
MSDELVYLCGCEFAVNPDDLDDDWHFLRTCRHCGGEWFGLHCPHDGHQNPCAHCGIRPTPEPAYVRADAVDSAYERIGNHGKLTTTKPPG